MSNCVICTSDFHITVVFHSCQPLVAFWYCQSPLLAKAHVILFITESLLAMCKHGSVMDVRLCTVITLMQLVKACLCDIWFCYKFLFVLINIVSQNGALQDCLKDLFWNTLKLRSIVVYALKTKQRDFENMLLKSIVLLIFPLWFFFKEIVSFCMSVWYIWWSRTRHEWPYFFLIYMSRHNGSQAGSWCAK